MTKYYTLCFCAVVLNLNLFSQEVAPKDTSWKKGGNTALNFNQVSFTNWAAGGENALSGAAYLSLFANYAKEKMTWDNQLDLAYGLTQNGSARMIKNEDKIEFNSKLGYKAGESKFFYTVLGNFKSQFDNGYAKPTDSAAVSKFLAPAYFLYSLGLDFKPNETFSVYLSPATGKTLLINDTRIADLGTYGNEAANMDASGNLIHGKKTFTQVGAYFRGTYKKDIFTNVNLQTKLELFSNYLNNPQNIAVNWEVHMIMKINKLMSASIGTQMIYDDIVSVPVIKDVSGVKTTVSGKRVQFKEVFGLGLSYKF